MSPRPDIAWQRLSSKGRWHGNLSEPAAEARVDVEGLRLAGGTAIGALRADLSASGGVVTLDAVVKELVIPGPQPKMFARDPLAINASLRLNEPTRPLLLTATQRLFSLRAQAVNRGTNNPQRSIYICRMSRRSPRSRDRMCAARRRSRRNSRGAAPMSE